jgi:DNA-binding NarL/FixJ family response regulator
MSARPDGENTLMRNCLHELKQASGDGMKFLVVDDHTLVRDALSSVLRQLKNDALVSPVSTCGQAMQLLEETADFDLVLLDLALPDRDGFSLLAELRNRHPTLPVVVLSASQERKDVVRALDLGAVGFIPKTTSREIMLSALQLVFSGGVYIPTEILQDTPALHPKKEQMNPDQVQTTPFDVGLTERQLDVLSLMMQGRSNKRISRALDLAEPTVKNHVTAILKALNVTNRTEAVITATKMGWKLPQVPKS